MYTRCLRRKKLNRVHTIVCTCKHMHCKTMVKDYLRAWGICIPPQQARNQRGGWTLLTLPFGYSSWPDAVWTGITQTSSYNESLIACHNAYAVAKGLSLSEWTNIIDTSGTCGVDAYQLCYGKISLFIHMIVRSNNKKHLCDIDSGGMRLGLNGRKGAKFLCGQIVTRIRMTQLFQHDD